MTAMSRIAVFGATGLTGGLVVKQALALGHEVDRHYGLLPHTELWGLLQVAVCAIERQLCRDESGVAGVSQESKADLFRGG